MIRALIVVGIFVWVGVTLLALRKDKMLALVLFFSIPVAASFILIMILIVVVSMKKPIM